MCPVQTNAKNLLTDKILNRAAKAEVIVLGYVGLPLAVEFSIASFSVTGIDTATCE